MKLLVLRFESVKEMAALNLDVRVSVAHEC